MRQRALPVILVLLLLSLLAVPPARAQDAGGALISSPLAGHVVSGRLAISGTAVMSQFDRYELTFAHDPNPTDTWFFIAEASRVPVSNDVLAEWDVSGITDGNYMLRLMVYGQDGTHLEAIVRGIIVQNTTPTPPPPAPTDAPVTGTGPTSTPEPEAAVSPTPLTGQLPLPPTLAPSSGSSAGGTGDRAAAVSLGKLGQAFWSGARWTFLAFLLLGAYAGVRKAFRSDFRRWTRRLWATMQK